MGKAGIRSPRNPRITNITRWHNISCKKVRVYRSYNTPGYNAMSGGKEELKDNVSLILRSSIAGFDEAERGRMRQTVSSHASMTCKPPASLDFPGVSFVGRARMQG